jgi:microcystin degradation protein MlrC
VRIAIGQVAQESNTFNPWPTTRAEFEQFGVLRGPALINAMADTNELGGFIQSLRAWPERPEIVGLVRLFAWPSGPANADTFLWLLRALTDSLAQQMPVDAVLLALHGALVADGVPDVEGEVLQAVRQIIGPDVPLVVTLDLHANITERMARLSDALVLYHTIPHTDVFETGQRAAAVLRRILMEGAKPVTAFQKVPVVFPAERANTREVGTVSHRLGQRLDELERSPSILAAGLATVQPWLDIPELGSAVVVVSEGKVELARMHCTNLAAELWEHRREYLPELVPVADAVLQARQNPAGLVVLSDSADSTTSGAPGDSTWVLRELFCFDWPRPALVTLVAPEVVQEAQRQRLGAEMTTPLGGVRDYRFSQPLTVSVQVAGLFEARFIMSGHLARNLPIDMGPSAVLRHDNVHIVATSRSGPHFAPELFRAAGLDPFAASVLVAKSPCGFRAAYQDKAAKILVVRAPGCAPADFWTYPYHRIPHPLWPWDDALNWSPAPRCFRKGQCV